MLVHIPSHDAVGAVERLLSDGQVWHLAALAIRERAEGGDDFCRRLESLLYGEGRKGGARLRRVRSGFLEKQSCAIYIRPALRERERCDVLCVFEIHFSRPFHTGHKSRAYFFCPC